MEKTIKKPIFKETVAVTTMELDDGLVFNAQEVGPMNFASLRNADYGKDFRMPTMPEIVPLVYASLENKNYYDTAKNVIKTLRNNLITCNTGILYVPNGMYVQDKPERKDGRIFMDQKVLEKKLGSREENGVVFSDDGSVRLVSYDFKRGSQSALDLARNLGIIALTGSEENAEKLAKASEHYKLKPYFWALENVDSPQIRVADLGSGSFGGRLGVGADVSEGYGGGYSFGIFESARKSS